MKTVLVMFENVKDNYMTSFNYTTNQSFLDYFADSEFDLGSYPVEKMRRSVNSALVLNTTELNALELSVVTVFDPVSNTRPTAIYCKKYQVVIALDTSDKTPYYNHSEVLQGILNNGSSFVDNVDMLGFPAYHCHNNTYRLSIERVETIKRVVNDRFLTMAGFVFNIYTSELISKPHYCSMSLLLSVEENLNNSLEYIKASRIRHLIRGFHDVIA